jgi:thiol:disulfide interchange protein
MISLIAAMATAMALTSPAAVYAATTNKFDATRDAKADVAAAVSLARSEGKYVLVDVGGEWCIWCHILDGFFDDDTEARALRDRYYVLVKVNWSPQNHNAALLSQWPAIPGYPHLFVLDGQGKLVHSQSTGELERGRGYNRDKIMAFLRRFAPPPAAAQSLLLPFAGSGVRATPLA